MTWKTELDKEQTTLRIQCSGDLSTNDLTMLAIEAGFLAQQHVCAKILVDLAEVSAAFPLSGLSELLDSYADYHLPQTTRTGIVLGPLHTSQDLAQVLAAAKRHGYTVEALTGEQSKVWLLDKL